MTIQAIVTDIEGTTSDIAFVHDVLFPYAAKHLPDFVRANAGEPQVAEVLQATREHVGQPQASDAELIELFLRWIDTDQKVTPLKTLQGLIWKNGYENGDFTGHIYADAVEKLRAWQAAGIALYVYSSGSEAAQKLLFGHSDAGDLTAFFSDFFDTRVGAKKQAASYAAIADATGQPADRTLFLSDVEAELQAAAETGMQTCLLVRDGDPVAGAYTVARDFHQVSQHFNLP